MTLAIDVAESRTVRFRRSALLRAGVRRNIKPEIKVAETLSEWQDAYQLLVNEYRAAGYLDGAAPSQPICSIHHFLPKTKVFIAKTSNRVTATLSQYFDDPIFGLPMDSIYKEELDHLRADGRRISEIGGLSTREDARWQSLFLHLCRVMYWYSRHNRVDDLCITVTPKHIQFYKKVFLFEELGPTKYYPKFNVPAILLRLDLNRSKENLRVAYDHLEDECNLHNQFHRLDGVDISDYSLPLKRHKVISDNPPHLPASSLASFLSDSNGGVLSGLTSKHATYLNAVYPNLLAERG